MGFLSASRARRSVQAPGFMTLLTLKRWNYKYAGQESMNE